jgi:hypothetical protein
MKGERFYVLLEQYITDMINKEDRKEFLSLLEDPQYRSLLEKVMEKEWKQSDYEESKNDEIGNLIEQNVMERIRGAKVILIRRANVIPIRKIVAVAVLLILMVGAYYFISPNSLDKGAERTTASRSNNEIKLGSNTAVLTLGDGLEIVLDSSIDGTVARQGGTRLDAKGEGFLAYNTEHNTGDILFNTVTTPRGCQYHLKLADGTEVWLDAASSIRFPATFSESERSVEITGQAYFEVAHNEKKPFRVAVKGMQVQVLGTHFNINAFKDEPLWRTTLVQGKIKISRGKLSAVLLPGYQANISGQKSLSVLKDVDTREVLSWKNGYVSFKYPDIAMRQIARWYDVEILYKGSKPQGPYKGEINRSMSASTVLHILNASGIHSKIEGKKIIVMD